MDHTPTCFPPSAIKPALQGGYWLDLSQYPTTRGLHPRAYDEYAFGRQVGDPIETPGVSCEKAQLVRLYCGIRSDIAQRLQESIREAMDAPSSRYVSWNQKRVVERPGAPFTAAERQWVLEHDEHVKSIADCIVAMLDRQLVETPSLGLPLERADDARYHGGFAWKPATAQR